MSDGRKRSTAKQARRDARRRKAQRRPAEEAETPEEVPLIDEVREALDGGQPLDLLGLASMVVEATAPQPLSFAAPAEDAPPALGELVDAFAGVPILETTALLAVLGEIVVSDEGLRERCRREVESRDDDLPHWLTALSETTVYRAVCMRHVLGDGDEFLLAVRLADCREFTCAAHVDHLAMSAVGDGFLVPEPLDGVLAVATASNTDPDTTFVELELTEARHRLATALEQPSGMFAAESDTWPSSRPLVRWLTRLLPAGDPEAQVPQREMGEAASIEAFFGAPVGTPFDDPAHRLLLGACIEDGTGDPLRWSAPRLRQLLDGPCIVDDSVPTEVQLHAPELLRAFVPFVHAAAGIRQELTDEALAVIDEVADDYRAQVADEAQRDDDEERR